MEIDQEKYQLTLSSFHQVFDALIPRRLKKFKFEFKFILKQY